MRTTLFYGLSVAPGLRGIGEPPPRVDLATLKTDREWSEKEAARAKAEASLQLKENNQ
jgi:hypothetical protein